MHFGFIVRAGMVSECGTVGPLALVDQEAGGRATTSAGEVTSGGGLPDDRGATAGGGALVCGPWYGLAA